VDLVKKPAGAAAALLGLNLPPSAPADDEWALHAFCRRSGWDVWVKGPWAEAVRAAGWPELTAAVKRLADHSGGRDGVFVQRHVEGRGESVAFCARAGRLLGAAAVVKRVATDTGKTWTGEVLMVPTEVTEILARFVSETGWTGGGEIEMIRDSRGGLWLIEINPRFPAWVFGASLAGVNLPALLVAAELGVDPPAQVATSGMFTRLVIEAPLRRDVGQLLDAHRRGP
jgi:predicted ATP-grasp superfamily ATP-dependent carboligase